MFRRRQSPGIGVFLLAAQLFRTGFHRIPPVTLAVIVLNTAIYLRAFAGLPTVSQACISFDRVWNYNELRRIYLSPFFHLDDMHLYYNMASFIWKGISLENRLESGGMLYLLSVFSALTSLTYLALNKCLSILLHDPSYLNSCAAGFSGVIFALKVVTTYHAPPGMSQVFFFHVPSRLACWVELVIIHLLVPSTSFTGHLSGILIGFVYVKGPLKQIMDSVVELIRPYPRRPSYTYNARRSGFRHERSTATEDEDQQLQRAIRESLREVRQTHVESSSHSTATPGTNQSSLNREDVPTNEEIRQRRLRRFQN